MNEYLNIKQAAAILGCSSRHIGHLISAGQLPGAIKRNRQWQIPVSAHPELARNFYKQKKDSIESINHCSVGKKEKAVKRLGLLKKFEHFAAQNNYGKTEALRRFCIQNSIAPRSFLRWQQNYKIRGLSGLADKRGGGKDKNNIISPEAWELFKSMYLTQQQLSLKICWQNICFINKDQGKGWQIPSLWAMYKYTEKNIPEFVKVLHREGITAYNAKCAPYIEIDPESIQPGQIWVGDHHNFNCWIRHKGRWVRPWITAWMDMRSRFITGFHISVNPNQSTILLAMKRGVEKYGPPETVRIDNGRDYDSEMWTGTTKIRRRQLAKGYIDEAMVAGLYAMMDTAVIFAIPYHPQSKSIERFFDTLDMQFTKTIKTYCGKNTDRKPEALKDYLTTDKAAAEGYEPAGFTEMAGQFIDAYNNSAHTGSGMEGLSPAAIFNQRQHIRILADGVTELLMRGWSGELTVGKNGIRFRGIWFGQYDLQLMAHQGQKVRAAYDPDDLRKVFVYDAATMKLITIAEQARLIQFGSRVNEESLRDAMAQKSRAVKIARQFVDTRLAANMDLTSLTIRAMQDATKENLTTENTEKSRFIRPVRTPFDGQVAEHLRQARLKAVRKAVGAENIEEVMDFDFSKPKQKKEKLDFFNG